MEEEEFLIQFMFLFLASPEQHILMSQFRERHQDKGLITHTQELPTHEEPGERISLTLMF
jgi:hypothetical protein